MKIRNFLILGCLLAAGDLFSQCRSNNPSGSIEYTTSPGFIFQGGITGQSHNWSIHGGVKVSTVQIEPEKGNNEQNKQLAIYPRLEVAYRIFETEAIAIHTYAGLSRLPDAGFLSNIPIGRAAAIRVRAGYERKPFVAAGIFFIFE